MCCLLKVKCVLHTGIDILYFFKKIPYYLDKHLSNDLSTLSRQRSLKCDTEIEPQQQFGPWGARPPFFFTLRCPCHARGTLNFPLFTPRRWKLQFYMCPACGKRIVQQSGTGGLLSSSAVVSQSTESDIKGRSKLKARMKEDSFSSPDCSPSLNVVYKRAQHYHSSPKRNSTDPTEAWNWNWAATTICALGRRNPPFPSCSVAHVMPGALWISRAPPWGDESRSLLVLCVGHAHCAAEWNGWFVLFKCCGLGKFHRGGMWLGGWAGQNGERNRQIALPWFSATFLSFPPLYWDGQKRLS